MIVPWRRENLFLQITIDHGQDFLRPTDVFPAGAGTQRFSTLTPPSQGHRDFLLTLQKFHQQHHSLFSLHRQEDGFQFDKGPLVDTHPFSAGKPNLHRSSAIVLAKFCDQGIFHRERLASKTDNSRYAAGRTQGRPVIIRTELNKQVTWKQRFANNPPPPLYNTLAPVRGAKAGISLVHQMGHRPFVLARLALDQIPGASGEVLTLADSNSCSIMGEHNEPLLLHLP